MRATSSEVIKFTDDIWGGDLGSDYKRRINITWLIRMTDSYCSSLYFSHDWRVFSLALHAVSFAGTSCGYRSIMTWKLSSSVAPGMIVITTFGAAREDRFLHHNNSLIRNPFVKFMNRFSTQVETVSLLLAGIDFWTNIQVVYEMRRI